MKASDFREKARKALKGKWQISILTALIYTFFMSIVQIIVNYSEKTVFLGIISMALNIAFWILLHLKMSTLAFYESLIEKNKSKLK